MALVLVLDFKARVIGDEGPAIRRFLDQLGHRRAGAMPGAGLDADQGRRVARLRRLKRGGVFERMARHDAVIGIRRRNQSRRILAGFGNVVIGRLAIEHVKHFRVLRAAIVIHPEPARGELVEPQHVHHAHRRQSRGKQVRRLIGDRADQKTAV